MTKITIVSCIIAAVCVFQTAEAGLLDDVKNQVTDTLGHTLGDMLRHAKEAEERGKKIIDSIKNGIEASQKALQTTACTNVYSVGLTAITDLISSVESCVSHETESASGDVQRLLDAGNNLLVGLGKYGQDALTCFQNPLKITECFSTDISKLDSVIQEFVYAGAEVAKNFPNMRACYENAVLQSVGPNSAQLVKDVEQCVSNILQPLK